MSSGTTATLGHHMAPSMSSQSKHGCGMQRTRLAGPGFWRGWHLARQCVTQRVPVLPRAGQLGAEGQHSGRLGSLASKG